MNCASNPCQRLDGGRWTVKRTQGANWRTPGHPTGRPRPAKQPLFKPRGTRRVFIIHNSALIISTWQARVARPRQNGTRAGAWGQGRRPKRNGARLTRTLFSLPLKQGQAAAVFLASAWEALVGRFFARIPQKG